MKVFGNRRTSLTNLFVAAVLGGCYCAAGAADGQTAQYWLDHPAERAKKLKECSVQDATRRSSPDCVSAGRAAAAALGSGKPVYVGAPTAPAAAPPPSPSDHACTMEALKAIQDKEAREDMASACIRRGTFKSSSKRAF